jgi:hypothetical protein
LLKIPSLQIFIHFPVFLFATNPLFTGLQHEMSHSNKGSLKNVAQVSCSEHFQLIKYPPYRCGKRQTRPCTYEPTSSCPAVSPRGSLVLLWFKGIVCMGGIHVTRALLLGSSDKDTQDKGRTWIEMLSSLRTRIVDRSSSVFSSC